MPGLVIVGTQWGDEGKGKLVDLLGERVEGIARFQGGNNAGHTVVIGEEKFILHLIPSGMLHPGKSCFIGNGVVVDPEVLLKEIDGLKARGVGAGPNQLRLSERAHLIMPYHKALDLAREKAKGNQAIGTTGRGIGPCYEDKSSRVGIRVGDLLEPGLFREKVERNTAEKNFWLSKYYGEPELSAEEIISAYTKFAERLAPYIGDVALELEEVFQKGGKVLFEGAQGTHLDIDHGTYPYVTSSNPVAGSACSGAGVGLNRLSGVLGIVKAYTTRVGSGPFITELEDEVGMRLRDKGAEFGSTTGRPRRCGWLDAVVVRHAVRLSGVNTLAVTKLDVLTGIPTLKICVGYLTPEGKEIAHVPASLNLMAKLKPVYKEYPGWEEDITGARKLADLPANCRDYLEALAQTCGAPISLVSVGPARDATMELIDPLAF